MKKESVGSASLSQLEKLLARVLSGQGDASIPFDQLCHLLQSLGFEMRINGSHHIFTRSDVPEILNLQPKGALAKPYQVGQVRGVIVRHGMKLGGR